MKLAEKCLLIHMDSVTHYAPVRRRKQKHGPMLTVTLFLLAVTAAVFGRGMA